MRLAIAAVVLAIAAVAALWFATAGSLGGLPPALPDAPFDLEEASPAPPPSEAASPQAAAPSARPPVQPIAPPSPATRPGGPPLRWLAAGGGEAPESNQVSIEQDLALAREVFGPGGAVLYAGGPHTRAVQVLAPREPGQGHGSGPTADLLAELGTLFSPRGGRDARYRATTLAPDGPATLGRTLDTLMAALATPGPPLLLYLAGHGSRGEGRSEGLMHFWGREALDPVELAESLDAAPLARPLRLVMTSCHSGSFAELAFRNADPARGAAISERCGLFATLWTREASGCDPDPDRGHQQGYGLIFLSALRGQAPDGTALPREAVDFDGDGQISLLEAHTRVRIASRAVDVPVSTSERWLRQHAPERGPEAEVALPEEDAVVASLTRDLVLPAQLAAVQAQVDALGAVLAHTESSLVAAEDAEGARFEEVSAAMLSRWPVLDDPWHPGFAALLEAEGEAIKQFLAGDPRYAAFLAAMADVDELRDRKWQLEVKQAPFLRLARALQNRTLARRLSAAGGPALQGWQRLLACERSVPPLAP